MLFKMMKRLKKEEKGFTLIELLAVIVILAVIAAIAVPYILGVIDKSKKNSDVATFHQVYEAARLYVTSENIDVTTNPTIYVRKDLITKKYLEDKIVLPSNKTAIQVGKVEFSGGVVSSITLGTGTTSSPPTATKSWHISGANAIASTGETIEDTTLFDVEP